MQWLLPVNELAACASSIVYALRSSKADETRRRPNVVLLMAKAKKAILPFSIDTRWGYETCQWPLV